MTVNEIYTQICDVCLEPVLPTLPSTTGLQTGMLTQQQFLDFFSDTVRDFIQESGLVKKIFVIPTFTGTGTYTEYDQQMEVEDAFYNERYLSPTDTYNLDAMFVDWRIANGTPQTWNEDRVTVKAIQLVPMPIVDGFTVNVSADFLGTISAVAGATDFNVTTTANFLGTISSYTSPVYLDPVAGMYGTIGNMVPSLGNLMMSSTSMPTYTKTYQLSDFIQGIPDTFTVYLKYGVLERVFKMDGEMKDDLRERYCKSRFQEGVALARAIMQEVEEENI